jgi:hypothetical protein
VCRFHVAAGEKLHADKQFIWRPCPECHEASKHHLLKFGSFSYWFDSTLVSQLRDDLLLCSSYLLLEFPTGRSSISTPHHQRTRYDGRAQGGGTIWCHGGIDGRLVKVNALILTEDSEKDGVSGELLSVCNGVRSGFVGPVCALNSLLGVLVRPSIIE